MRWTTSRTPPSRPVAPARSRRAALSSASTGSSPSSGPGVGGGCRSSPGGLELLGCLRPGSPCRADGGLLDHMLPPLFGVRLRTWGARDRRDRQRPERPLTRNGAVPQAKRRALGGPRGSTATVWIARGEGPSVHARLEHRARRNRMEAGLSAGETTELHALPLALPGPRRRPPLLRPLASYGHPPWPLPAIVSVPRHRCSR
jgi:hypothetical protein